MRVVLRVRVRIWVWFEFGLSWVHVRVRIRFTVLPWSSSSTLLFSPFWSKPFGVPGEG